MDAVCPERSGRRARRCCLVHHPRARAERGAALGPPRLRSGQGLALAGLAGRPERRRGEDCRWTPCFDCGVCPQMDTAIEIGPTGKRLLPLTVLTAGKGDLL